MKKTLITAALTFGLSAVASAATILSDNIGYVSGPGNTINITNGTPLFSVISVVDIDKLSEYTKVGASATNYNIFTVSSANDSSSADVTVRTDFNSNGGKITQGCLDARYGTTNYAVTNVSDTTWDNAVFATVTLACDYGDGQTGTGSSLYITMYDSQGTVLSTLTENAGGLRFRDLDLKSVTLADTGIATEAYAFNGKLSADDVAALGAEIYAASVPEPATASLSLLGLAALMMRRRRA